MRLQTLTLPVLGLLVLTGCPKRNEFAEPPPPSVSIEVVQPLSVTVFDTMPGQTAAVSTADVVARVKGFLESQEFEDGAVVEKDQVLFTIDPAEFQANLEAAQGKLSSAIASRDLADTTFKRNKELFATQAISELEMLQSEATRSYLPRRRFPSWKCCNPRPTSTSPREEWSRPRPTSPGLSWMWATPR